MASPLRALFLAIACQLCACKRGVKADKLEGLFNAHHSDKGFMHGYHRFYNRLLPDQADEIHLLEIGVSHGGSMKAWEEYFTNSSSRFLGLAYAAPRGEAKKSLRLSSPDPRTNIIYGDQSNATVLTQLAAELSPLDLIIDDGSHVPSHQWLTLLKLWPLVKPGGHFTLEDVETSYWKRGSGVYAYSLKEETSLFPRIFDLVHAEVNAELSRRPSMLPGLVSVEFGLSMIILRKAGPEDERFVRPRQYRWPHNLPSSEKDALPGAGLTGC